MSETANKASTPRRQPPPEQPQPEDPAQPVGAALPDHAPRPQVDANLRRQARKDVLLYGLARLGLFLALTVVIQLLAFAIGAQVPLIMSSLLALLVAFPLSMFVFKSLRLRVTEEIAQWDEQRKAHKRWIKSELDDR